MSAARAAARATGIRVDLQVVADMVTPGKRVLDLGCGDGALLEYLVREKGVDGRGIEISQAGVNACVSRGLSVVQGDVDTDLGDYPNDSFDYVILSQTLPATRRPRELLRELLRIGHCAIVSFPNMGYWRARLHLLRHGRMPVTDALPQSWWETPNIHLCSIRDFISLCDEMGIEIERALIVNRRGQTGRFHGFAGLANLMGEHGVFLLCNGRRACAGGKSGASPVAAGA